MSSSFSNKPVAVVTGASSGIGAVYAERLGHAALTSFSWPGAPSGELRPDSVRAATSKWVRTPHPR